MSTCTRCGKQIPADAFETLCLTCQVMTTSPALGDTDVRGRKMKIIVTVGLLAVVGLAAGGILWKKRATDEENFRRDFPVGMTSVERERGEKDAAAWKKVRDKIVAAAKAFDATAKVTLPANAAPCPLAQKTLSSTEVNMRNTDHSRVEGGFVGIHDRERYVDRRLIANEYLVDNVIERLDTSLAAIARGRFGSAEARDSVLDVLAQDSLVIIALTTDERPAMAEDRNSFESGHRVGAAYVFDRATGDLACYGAFEAGSSDEVVGLEGYMSSNLTSALDRDFEANTDRAIAASVRSLR